LISGPGVDENTRRASIQEIQDEKKKKGVKDYVMGAVHSVF
jgi:amino acid transporter